jgi:endonuclease G
MKIESIARQVNDTCARLTPEKVAELRALVRGKTPPQLVDAARLALRDERLSEADFRPSRSDRERILGTNDLVDINYLARAQMAAKSVCRIILRDAQGREIGYGTGFKVAPNVLMTNEHVLENAGQAATAVAEFNYELDLAGRPAPTTRFKLDPQALFFNDRALDFAIVGIDPAPVSGTRQLDSFGFLRMLPELGKVNVGEFVTIIQHPAGQPKQIALRENQLLSIEETVLWYQSDTAPGSSGSAVLNDSWQIVAIHHSGIPRKDAAGRWLKRNGTPADASTDDADIDWIANEGVRISRIIARIRAAAGSNELVRELDGVITGEIRPEAVLADPYAAPAPLGTASNRQQLEPISGGARITFPVSFDIRVADAVSAALPVALTPSSSPRSTGAGAAVATETLKTPIMDNTYGDRKGYDRDFLGVVVPLPKVTDKTRVSKMENGEYEIPYQHFSVVIDKTRRLALFAASNVSAVAAEKRPEAGRDYSRRALGGFGANDREQWVTDPRIPEEHQLPDVFYNRDRQAFDKGHLVRREDVCFGSSYRMVQRANGDTYHTTNCTPQVIDFNRSGEQGIWGQLENEILRQAKAERYCLFAGPLLRGNDRFFEGVDSRGPVRVRIPSAFWKVVVAVTPDNVLQAFGFLLEQDLSQVQFEFTVSADWRREMISLKRLQQRIGVLDFPQVVLNADQFGIENGNEVARITGFPPAVQLNGG